MAVSAAKLEANRRNGLKGGPRTEIGKQRSKFNALKHGMRAETMVLPEEDPQAFDARRASWTARLAPGDDVEQRAVDEAVAYTWMQDRARRAHLARIKASILDFGVGEANAVALEVEDLGRRLFTDRLGPATFYPTVDKYRESTSLRSPSTSDAGNGRDDPNRPGPLVLRLRSTLQGCQWMLGEWARLKSILDDGQAWVSSDKLKAVRLLGKQPVDAINDRDVAIVFIASFVLKPAKGEWSWEIMTELNSADQKRFRDDAASRQLESLKPADGAGAREMLLALIARASEALTAKADDHRRRAQVKAALAVDCCAFDASPAGERLRRHEQASSRGIARSLGMLVKLRRAPELNGEFVSCPSSVVSGESMTQGPADELVSSPASVVNGEFVSCPSSGVSGASMTSESIVPQVRGECAPSSGPAGHLLPAAGEGDFTNEPTDGSENVTNEPTDLQVSCPSSVVSGASMTSESIVPQVRGECAPSSGPAGHLLPAGGEGDFTNEPTDGPENATNEPTDLQVICPSSVVSGASMTSEPIVPQVIGECGPSSGPPGHLLPGGEVDGTSGVDAGLNAEIDSEAARAYFAPLLEKVRREREEQLRELNEQARREREASKALRGARRAERTSRKPAVCSRQQKGKQEISERKQLERATAALARLRGGLVPAPRRAAAPAKGPGP